MLKNIFLISCTLLSSSINFDSYAGADSCGNDSSRDNEKIIMERIESDKVSARENKLEYAESSCNVNVYSAALQKYITSLGCGSTRIIPNPDRIIMKCYKSGNLNALVQTNINAGGNPRKSGYCWFNNYNHSSLCYDESALRVLSDQEMGGLSPKQTADISSTVDTLVKAGCNIHSGLPEAAARGNMPFAQILLEKGANIYSPIYIPSLKCNVSAIGVASMWDKIKLMTLQACVSLRKRHANLEDL